jgi:signal transduction histidine kinase
MRDHPRHTDVGLVVALIALTMLSTALPAVDTVDPPKPAAWGYALGVVGVVPLLWRRTRPIVVLAACLAAVGLYQLLDQPDSTLPIAPVIAAYSVACYHASRRVVHVTAAVLLSGLAVLGLVVAIVTRKAESLWGILGNTIIFGTALLAGDNLRRRRERLADLEARAAAEESTRQALAREAVSGERQRIARELHDVVAHSLSVIVVQAGAARRIAASRPERAADALAAIEATGREALDEMRRLLGVLRAGPAPGAEGPDLAPQPSLRSLDSLVAADPTLPVDVHVDGEAVALPATVDLQAYRIVQEALTNVRKHAGPARATVRVRYGAGAIEIHVDDDGRGASAPLGVGHGLVGMRERAALCGGEVHAGPRPGGGWSVVARLPLAATQGAA